MRRLALSHIIASDSEVKQLFKEKNERHWKRKLHMCFQLLSNLKNYHYNLINDELNLIILLFLCMI